MPETHVIQLEIPSLPEYITVAREALEAIASRTDLTQEQTDDLKLALGEACSNAVKFSRENSVIRVVYAIKPGSVEIQVQNRGETFSREKWRPVRPSTERLSEGGIGMYLIEQLTDELSIQSRRGVTTVRMVKYRT